MVEPSLFDELGDRRCCRCGEIKPLNEFSAGRRANGRVKFRSDCRPCRKAYQREWYLAHREDCLAAAAARRAVAKERLVSEPPPIRQPLREAVGFRAHGNTRLQGDAGLGIAIAYFSRIGAKVGIPLTDSQPYDLMVDDGRQLARVQVRTTTVREGRSYVVGLKTVGGNKTQTITKIFDPKAYEWLFVVCGDATAYLIPTTAIRARYSIFLGRKYERFRLED
jgi:PD-(D/E)XK nuclease superfamily protein